VDFPYCGQVAQLERITTDMKTRTTRQERVNVITSCGPDRATPEQLLAIVRGHWAIENRSHWVRDVTFDEDRSQIRTKSAPRAMATLRNLAVALARLLDFRSVPAAIRFFGRRSARALDAIGF